MKKRHSKYKILKGFNNSTKAQKFLENLSIPELSIIERKFGEKDKTKFYVRQLIRKGAKK